ncbi:oligoribonuclease [Glutamicibacter ardleyensis]|uniref:oligoribonuclease n=1 Tax=Glutamicibacter ardleyensis TaxID=225894 RepID=UPI003FCFB15B
MKQRDQQIDGLNLVWADFETTGLPSSPGFEPIEVAVTVTNPTATEVLWESGSLVIKPASVDQALVSMNSFVRNMHTETGLIARLVAGEGQSVEDIDAYLIGHISPLFPEPGEKMRDGQLFRGAVLAGNSVGQFDLEVVRRFFPEWSRIMGYRVLDVSSIENMMRRSFPVVREALPAKTSDHTATHDIAESIREYRHYVEAFGGL